MNLKKTPLDYIESKSPLIPVQVRLPEDLVKEVKAKLEANGLTFTDFIKGACHWFVDEARLEDLKGQGLDGDQVP
jgi:predicted DNA binding CopG/RHH family protein